MKPDRIDKIIPHQINLGLMKKVIGQQESLIESYLHEFCKVNGIDEQELKNHLVIATYPPDNSIMVVNADDLRDIKFGIKINVLPAGGKFLANFEILGEYLDCKDIYPKTTELINNFNSSYL